MKKMIIAIMGVVCGLTIVVINAFKRYSGHGDEVEDDGDQYDDY